MRQAATSSGLSDPAPRLCMFCRILAFLLRCLHPLQVFLELTSSVFFSGIAFEGPLFSRCLGDCGCSKRTHCRRSRANSQEYSISTAFPLFLHLDCILSYATASSSSWYSFSFRFLKFGFDCPFQKIDRLSHVFMDTTSDYVLN